VAPESRAHFLDAWIEGNESKDRHVLAAAVHSITPVIVTFNLRHFREEHLLPWGISAVHTDRFPVSLLAQEPGLIREKVLQQAEDRHRSLTQLAEILRTTVPEFAHAISPLRT
jgi:hypothetical protein